MSHRFKAVFERDPDGGYSVFVPALPGCASQGDSLPEAQANIEEAIELYLWSLREDGLPIPESDPELLIKEIEVVAS
jgi:predicted RNase H-like HicB family nuclease